MSDTPAGPLVISGRVDQCEIGNFIVLARREADGDSAPVAYVADSLEAANLCLYSNCFDELLTALKCVDANLRAEQAGGPEDPACPLLPDTRQMWRQVRAAIAKAERSTL